MSGLFAHIAVCIDNSEASSEALEEAWRLHRSLGSPRFSLVHVIASPRAVAGHGGMWVPDPGEMGSGAKEWLDDVVAAHAGAEVAVLHGYPAAEVCHWAVQADVDLLVAASSRGLFDRILLGSFAGHLSHHAPCSVLLTRPHAVREQGEAVVEQTESGS